MWILYTLGKVINVGNLYIFKWYVHASKDKKGSFVKHVIIGGTKIK